MRKTTFFVLFYFLFCFFANAQTSSHLAFRGIPIDGSLYDYTTQLRKLGYAEIARQKDGVLLKGTFAATPDCNIFVGTTKENIVYGVAVEFPEASTWSELQGTYNTLREMLTKKYGQPANTEEYFQSSYPLKDDDMKFSYVKWDRCKYITTFETEKGNIVLEISHREVDFLEIAFVSLSYIDKQNILKKESSAYDDL